MATFISDGAGGLIQIDGLPNQTQYAQQYAQLQGQYAQQVGGMQIIGAGGGLPGSSGIYGYSGNNGSKFIEDGKGGRWHVQLSGCAVSKQHYVNDCNVEIFFPGLYPDASSAKRAFDEACDQIYLSLLPDD